MISIDQKLDYNFEMLDTLIQAFRENNFKVKIGVIGEQASASREPSEDDEEDLNPPSNAEVGLIHEFGGTKMPMRSFLRYPLYNEYNKALAKAIGKEGISVETLEEIIAERTFRPLLAKMALVAEDVVLGAFETGGYGKWKISNMKYKKVHQTLVETQQLRNSIASEVIEE